MNWKVALVKRMFVFGIFWNKVMERHIDQCQYSIRAMKSKDFKYGRNRYNVRTLDQAKSKVLEANRSSHLMMKLTHKP